MPYALPPMLQSLNLGGLPSPLPAPPINYLRGLPTSPYPNATGAFLRSLPAPPAAPPANFLNTFPAHTSASLPEGLSTLGQEAASGGASGLSRFIPSVLAPSAEAAGATGRLAFLRSGAGGLKPGLAVAAAGTLESGAGDYLRSQGHEGAGGALQGAGLVTTLGAPAAAIPGVAAAPLIATAGAGGAVGDVLGNLVANPIRRAIGMDDLQNSHLSNLTDPGGALSWLPFVGGGSEAPAGPDLSPQGLKSKLDSFNLAAPVREQVKQAFNQRASDLRAQGVPLEQATAQAYAQFFEPTKDEKTGAVTQNALALQLRDEAAQSPPQFTPDQAQAAALQQAQLDAAKAAAFQTILSQMAPEIMGHDPSAQDRSFFASLPAMFAFNQTQQAQAAAAQAQNEYAKADLAAQLREKYSGGSSGADLKSLLGE